ncbi:PadR family transcriptional regulator [Jiangella alba]|uniref:Transcriptional regulator PadR-like family protein n=1 Tax=Jiangella alba TaxID=561176 RepID=A0A1H5PGT0_9ACTN|nr:PadR family transcriptional regulator [Jiangella alba]SEF12926.1 Transcriptional regulator PadR-like family protein [Jiangella alba]
MHGRRGGHGFGPWDMFGGGRGSWGGPPWGGGPWGGPPWARRGPKARRGDIRAAILGVLADRPMNGYQMIQEIAERSGGAWKPSPGSIYPTLQQLEDEGLIEADEASGRRTFRLTSEGETYVQEHAAEVNAPWESMSANAEDDDAAGLRPLVGQTAQALWQIMATGSPDQQARAREVLADTRRKLYGILADGDDPEGGPR